MTPNPCFTPDVITGRELSKWWQQIDPNQGYKYWRRAHLATNHADTWSGETRALIEAANNGDEEAQWVIAQVIAWRITR